MPKYKVNGRTFNIPDNEVDLFEADFPEAQLHYQTNDGRKFTIYANERKDFLSDFPDATELGWSETIKEQAKQADPFQSEDNLVQPLFGSMSYQDNIGKPEDSLYYPSPLSEEGRADYEPITAEERSKQEYDMLMRQLNDFDAQNGNFMDTYEAYEKAAKHQVNEGGFALDTMEREYVNANSNDYHLRKQERDALNERIRNNSYFNKMRMEEADAANETVDAISNLMAQNEAENTELHKKMKAMNALAMNPRGSFSGFSKTKEMQDYVDERDDLLTAKRLYENTAQVYAAPINDGEDVLKKFGQGFAQRGDDLDFWTMGIVGIADDMNARAAFQKIQDKFGSVKEFANLTDAEIDALLTPSEQLLISAVMDNNAALYARKDNTAGAYEAGAGAADSLMFMAQFLLTGGIGDAATVGTAAHKRLVSWLGRKVGSMSNGLMKDVARGTVKLGVGTAESIGKALVMTPLMPHTYANIADKMMKFDDSGELMDTTDAIISGSIDALIETWSESTGEFVNKVLGIPGGITKGVAKKVMKNVDFSDWGRAMNAPMMKILRKGGFNGFLGEMGEEFIGNATRSLVGTLAPGSGQDPEALKKFAQWEQLLITAGSFAPMTIFGLGVSGAQYGWQKRQLNNAQKAFEAMLREASYTEDQTKFIIDELLGSTDAHLTPERLVANFSPLLRELAFNDKFANNRTQAMQSAVDFMWEIARYRTFDGVYHRQEEQQRNDMLAEIQEGTGREFWTTRLSENAGLDGTAYETDEVRVVEFNDGRVAYVLGGDGVNNTVVYNDGQTGFLSEEQLNEGKANGSIVSDATMGLNDYLTQQVARVRMTEEEQRMFTERNTNIGQVRAQFPIDATVELGTTEAPIQGVVRQQTPNGVIVESPAGISQLTWEELGHTIGVEVNPQTDAQMEEEAINNLEIADLQRRRAREQRRAQRNTAAEAALETEQMVDEAENEGLEKPIPMKADGTVDQTAFWNESPARWAQWKTEQRQDGGAYASTYIQNAIGILEGQIEESEAAFLAESDFDAKDALEQTINQQKARLAELQDLAMQYMPSVIPAETSAEASAEQTQPGAETSQPAAVMADRQKFELDAEYQRRLSLAKALAEKEMILKEYFEAISAGSMEAVVMNKQNYKQVMKDMGCDEAAIEEVTNAIKEAEEENTAVNALHVNDKIFVIAEYNYTVEQGRISYVHERQHNITKRNPELIQRVLSLGLSRETLQKIVSTLSGTTFYDTKSDEVLADEILSSTMEIAYTFDDFSVTLSKLGLPIELINLINEINNEQRNDYSLANARRNTIQRNDRQRSSRQDVGDQGEVSGGILGEEGDGSQETGLRRTESGEPATGGAEASEEGLQVPVAEVEEAEEESEVPSSRITSEMDEAYLRAVEAGDMETAQRMVIEAARLAMPNTRVVDENGNPLVVYHGTNTAFTEFQERHIGSLDPGYFGRGFYFTPDRSVAEGYAKGANGNIIIGVFLDINNPIETDMNNTNLFGDRLEGHDGVIVRLGEGGIAIDNTNYDPNEIAEIVAKNANQIKSADAVTYDDQGNVIPLSQRFNPESSDIRFRTSADTRDSNGVTDEQIDEINRSVGGELEIGEEDAPVRFSISAIGHGAGLELLKDDGEGNVALVLPDGRKFNANNLLKPEDLKSLPDSVLSYMMSDARALGNIDARKEWMLWNKYTLMLNAILSKGSAENGGFEHLASQWQWIADTVYKTVATNSDTQYSYSLDITRVCKKNEAVINAIAEMQARLGYGITPGQIMDIYMSTIEEGYQVPCPVCYVFSRYIRNGKYATIMINGQRKYGSKLVDPRTLSEKEKEKLIKYWLTELDKIQKQNEANENEINKANSDITVLLDEIDKLSKQITDPRSNLTEEQKETILKKIHELDARYKAALNVVSQSSLDSWITQFAIYKKKEGGKERWVLYEDSYMGFPEEMALDLRQTSTVMRLYPAIQRFRKSRGAAAGKEITFVSNNDLGDVALALGSKGATEGLATPRDMSEKEWEELQKKENGALMAGQKNLYQQAAEEKDAKKKADLLKKARERFESASEYAKRQSLRGGQRMWSWSDNIERLAPDVFVNLFQMELLGGALQSYSKQLEGIKLVASMNGYVNGSLMGKGNGYAEVSEENVEEADGKFFLKGGDFVMTLKNGKKSTLRTPVYKHTDGKFYVLEFDDVVGIDAFGKDIDGKHYKGLFELNAEYDKAGNILVGMNDLHIRIAMADDRIFFIIPWHSSGANTHILAQMYDYLGVEYDVTLSQDYTDVQSEKRIKGAGEKEESSKKDKKGKEKKESTPVSIFLAEFWNDHYENAREYDGYGMVAGKDFVCGIEGGIASSDGKGNLSEDQMHYRELRDAIFMGVKVQTGTDKKGKPVYKNVNVEEYSEQWFNEIMNDEFLRQVLARVRESMGEEGRMASQDTKSIYPYEYWDESSTYATSSINGARYMEYCRRLGYKPKFCGKLDGKPENDFGNFTEDAGYWKTLIDRRMYAVDGSFQGLTPVTAENFTPDLVDPEVTKEEFVVTRVADEAGTQTIVDKAIAKEESRPGGIAKVDYDMTLGQALKAYNNGDVRMRVSVPSGAIDLVEEAKKAQKKHDAKAKKSKKSDVSFRITAEQDKAYMDAVEAGDMETAQRMVDAAARAAGYDSPKLYHGTQGFGFTKIDTSKSDDKISFFATESPAIARSYSGVDGERQVSSAPSKEEIKQAVQEWGEVAEEALLEYSQRLYARLNQDQEIDADEFMLDLTDRVYSIEARVEEGELSLGEAIYDIYEVFDAILNKYYNKQKYDSIQKFLDEKPAVWEERIDVARAYFDYFNKLINGGSFGNYSFYANTWGMLEVECNGSNWNDIKSGDLPDRDYSTTIMGRPWKTRGVAKYAKEEGYMGVIFKNIVDPGGRAHVDKEDRLATIYDFFEPQKQVKSADPVTYDDAGNVIPLSERFNPENEDIRFRVRTEEEREKLFADAKEKYGVTDNFNAAGYMLPDGSLLDFSEANDGGDPNSRSLDHRDIEGVIIDNGVEYDSRWMYIADFMKEGAIRLLPESAGINMIQAPTEEQRKKIFDFIYKYNGEVILEINDERLNSIAYMEYDRRTSPSRIFRDIDGYFNDGIVPQQNVRFRMSNENQAIFVSNAAKAVEGIKQEKATPEQWLKMLEKAGGLKAGEDKWMGLSDWLKASDKKTLTKQEVLDFINENMIVINEVHYGARAEESAAEQHALLEQRVNERYEEILDSIQDIEDYDEKRIKAFEQLKDELDEWGDYVDLDMYNVYLTFPYEDLGDYIEMADIFGVEISLGNPIYDVRLNYTTDGLNNKREIALTVPTIESWNESDLTHFGDAGDGRAIAWIRFGETTIKNKESDEALYNQSIDELNAFWDSMREKYGNGWQEYMSEEEKLREKEIVAKYRQLRKDNYRKVLVIDEIQSKRHQEGREKGYRTSRKDVAKATEAFQSFNRAMKEKYGENVFPSKWSEEDQAEFDRLHDEHARVSKSYDKGIPDAPFDKNWHELAMKRMLRYAAENGYDVIAWTKGEQQADRYDIGSVVENILSSKHENGSVLVGISMGGGYAINFNVEPSGKIIDGNYAGNNLSEIVGKEIANKILTEESVVLSGDGLRVGGEGMRGFYDKILPAFMNKYGKKWGVKVEDIDLPNLENGLTMHSIPVTEEMKASVMEGQVMFRMRGENESAREFMQDVVNNEVYANSALGRVQVANVDEATAKMFGYTLEKLKKVAGNYSFKEDLITIFAHENVDDSDVVLNTLYHEAIHRAVAKFVPDAVKVGELLWNNADIDEELASTKADILKNGYKEDEWHEEMLCEALSDAISAKVAQDIPAVLPNGLGDYVKQILDKIGYGKERKRGRISWTNPQRKEAERSSSSESDRGIKKEDLHESRSGLSSAERRVINEYFPLAFRMVDSNGNTLTPEQEEFFANSKAVDKDGNLLVLYHGTPRAGFTEFKSGWFTTSKEDAISYSGDRKGRLFDPNEKYEPETLTAGDFRLGYMTFDSEADRATFLERFPYADEVMSEREYEETRMGAEDEEYDALTARRKEFAEVWNAYREYERERFVDTTIGDLLANPEAYTEEDLMRAMMEYDSNASFDNLDDMSAEERRDALVSALQNANEEAEGGILDMVVPTRVPRNGEGQKHNDLGNRTYEVYANIERPYEIDANGRGSEFVSGDVYRAIEESLASEEYDGVIVRNWRTGRHQQLGDVVVPKNGSQIKLTSNENPTESSDIQFRITEEGEDPDIRFSIRTKSAPKKTGIGYKVFYLKDGKLYPPMVANFGGVDTPVLVWLDADAAPQVATSKTGRKKVKAGGKGTQGGSGTLAYRPGWHLGKIPYALQFNRGPKVDNPLGITGKNGEVIKVGKYFPNNFVWAEVEYANEVDYQDEAISYGYNKAGNFQHSLAGLPKVPEDGSYIYRTNANPATDPWIITGAMKVNRLLTPSEVDQMVIDAGREPQERQEGAVTDEQIKALNKELGLVEEEVSFRVTGTPTEDIVAEGVSLSPAQLASLAGDIFAALPKDVRKEITDGLNGNILGLQDAILQIPTSLATKEEWNDEDRQMAEVVAEQMTKAVGIEMTRPFSASEALWTLYNAVNKSTDLVSEASRALVRRNLGFDSQTLEMEKEARDGVRFRTVGNASANAQASMYNRGAANVRTRLKESFFDMYASAEELVKAIEKRSGKVAEGFENILMALNQQSSRGLAAMEEYERKFLNKMFDEIRDIMNKTDFKYEDIVRYVILKHGLERNVKMAQRDAKAHYQEIYDDIIAKIKGMNPAQKRTYLTNAQLRDADAKAELAVLQGVNTSALTPDQLRDHKKELAKAKKEAAEAAEHLVRAQKIATMTERDAQDELDKIFDNINNESDSVYKEMRKNDYSGISSMFYDTLGVDRKNYATEEEYQAALMQAKADKYDTLGDIEGAAQMEVTLFENAVNTDNLWKSINKATKETLRQQYEANMISKDQYENLRNMFEFYVPLRGFADNTAEDMYTYYRRPNSTGYTKPILGAEGRKTEAESPFGWIAAMAGSAIASNVKNEAKLALYYFVANRPDNGIATLSKTWFVHTPGDVDANGKKIFRPAYPPFNQDLSTDAAKQAYEDWQEQMRDLQKQGLAYEAGQRLNLGNSVVNISDTNKPEHIVNVKVGGKDYTIVINGNPRAAQAINGDLNIESSAQDYSTVFGPMLRWMSSVNTSYNPEFWITNMMRDMAFTMMAVNIKEDPAYRRKFKKNYAKAFKVISMVAKNENGTLGNSYIERMYKDFVKYGGVTGYTQIKDSETWEKEIENYLTSNDPASIRNGKAMRGVKSVFHAAHRFGESLEQVSRFAAFLTAMETGKSINEAINDAKEITVNFNRKGSGKMITLEEAKYLTDKNGQPLNKLEQWAVVGISSIAPLGRRMIMFFNAAIQGLNATYQLWKKNKLRSIGWISGYVAVGALNAVLHAMLDDDDDYLDIPQYERRNSLMIGGNGAYFKWALPQEARAFYALGDLAVESVMGRNPHQNVIGEALKISTEILPINPSEGWKAFMPSVAIPFVELALNEDYKGAPIYNEQKWLTEEERERSTKWSKAYSGTGDLYIGIAKVLNAATGGDEHDAGLINLQPEKMEHLVQSAFGGTIRTADKFINTIMAAFDPEEDVTVRQFPFLNRILTINDERYKNVHVNDVYDYYAAEAEHTLTLKKKYEKDKDKDSYNKLLKSDEYKWATIYSRYKKPIKQYQEKIRAADTTNERMELMKQQDELKRKMIKEISDL